MKFAAFTPHIPPDQLLPLARVADSEGYDAFALPDCVFHPEVASGRYPYSEDGLRPWAPDTPFVDPYTAFPAMAAVTENLSFFASVLKAPLRQPLLLAKQLGTAAAMFPGRIALGVGTTWMPEEFQFLSEDMPSRGARLDEMMDIVRLCTKPGWAEYHGEHYRFEKLMMSPVPEERIPIYVGGHARPALRRAATRGDGWLPAFADPDELRKVVPELRAMRADSPMANEPFEVIACCQEWPTLDEVHRFDELGVTCLGIVLFDALISSLEGKSDAIRRYADEVVMPLASA